MEADQNRSYSESGEIIFSTPRAWFKYIMPKGDFERLFPGFSEEISEVELADLEPVLSKLKKEYEARMAFWNKSS